MRTVEITPEALGIMTILQRDMLAGLFDGYTGVVKVRASIDFSLPDGYIYVVMEHQHGPMIHGGIDPEGSMST